MQRLFERSDQFNRLIRKHLIENSFRDFLKLSVGNVSWKITFSSRSPIDPFRVKPEVEVANSASLYFTVGAEYCGAFTWEGKCAENWVH